MRIRVMMTQLAALSLTAFAGTYSGGLGTQANPYRISTAADWQELTSTPDDWHAEFILTNDINLAGVNVAPVGNSTTRFTGVFDGRRYAVRNATISVPDQNYIGLFGYIGAVGHVRNLGVAEVDIHGGEAVGGLVGRNHGRVDFCYVTGVVRGDDWDTGGLAGSNMGGAIHACYADVAVTSNSEYVGGLVGYNLGDAISFSYAVGAVSGYAYVGGLVGANDQGHIIDCYSTGAASGTLNNVGGFAGVNWSGSIEGCFWDIQTSGIIAGDGQGKTTAEMQSKALFIDADWDFEEVWTICDGLQYPKLQWQISAADYVCPYGVGNEDFAVLSRCWLVNVSLLPPDSLCYAADLDGDGVVELSDLLLFADQWLR